MLNKYLKQKIGSLRLSMTLLIVLVYIFFCPKDTASFACLCGTVGVWLKFETERKTEDKND